MARKTRYVIVRLASVISQSTRVWLREREGPEVKKVLFDPAIGKEVLYQECAKIKGKDRFPINVKKRFGLV